jgi:hypothetical protein
MKIMVHKNFHEMFGLIRPYQSRRKNLKIFQIRFVISDFGKGLQNQIPPQNKARIDPPSLKAVAGQAEKRSSPDKAL